MRTFFILACVAQTHTLQNRPLDNQHNRLHTGGNTNVILRCSGFWILDCYSGFRCDSETLLSPEPGDREHGALGPTYLVRDFTAFHTFSWTNPHLGSKVPPLCFCMCCLYTLYIPVGA